MKAPVFEPTKLARLILLLTQKLGGSVPITKLTKLLYLIDLESWSRTGATMSQGQWVRYTYGPMLTDMPFELSTMEGTEITQDRGTAGGYAYREIKLTPEARFIPDFQPSELEIVADVVERYSKFNARDLKALTYETPPMKLAQKLEAKGQSMRLQPIPFEAAMGTSGTDRAERLRRIADSVRLHESAADPDELRQFESASVLEWQPSRQRAATLG